ncbi:ABC transporter ATP-binding protein [Frigidibacter sp. MR17.24]|uniref:ABC transporter ATP-binding protein n=1 Tax=Frigidibacter sp. MR17.24 TaxID=3127345 RepID=UPI003012C8A7
MITLEGVSRSLRRGGSTLVVADRIWAAFPPGRSVALLGRNGAGKSTLLRMIAGLTPPDAGRVRRRGSVSWPVGFAGGFHPDLTGAANLALVARLYGVDPAQLVDFVTRQADLGPALSQPFRLYSSGMRARLAFSASMAIRFDTYLVDEITAVGDQAFRARSEALLADRLGRSGAIVVSHSLPLLRRVCDCGAVLEAGRLTLHDDLEAAIAHHLADLREPSPNPADGRGTLTASPR